MSPAVLEGPGGWWLDADGALVHPAAGVAVVADVHLGYEWARGGGGDCLPAHSLGETVEKLGRVLDRAGGTVAWLVVAGDLVESRRPCLRTEADLAALRRWLEARGVALLALQGNHDPPRCPAAPETLEVAGWTVAHGHLPLSAPRTITGHVHPMLRAEGVSAPCFLVGPNAVVLPAFSNNAAGTPLEALGPVAGGPFRCLALAGGELLDFGSLDDLRRALRRRSRTSPVPSRRRRVDTARGKT